MDNALREAIKSMRKDKSICIALIESYRRIEQAIVENYKDEELFTLLAILKRVADDKKRNEICSKMINMSFQTADLFILSRTLVSYNDMFEIIKILGENDQKKGDSSDV